MASRSTGAGSCICKLHIHLLATSANLCIAGGAYHGCTTSKGGWLALIFSRSVFKLGLISGRSLGFGQEAVACSEPKRLAFDHECSTARLLFSSGGVKASQPVSQVGLSV